MTTLLTIVLYLLAAIGAIFVLVIIAAAMLAVQFSPDEGCLVNEGRVPASGSDAQDRSRSESPFFQQKGNQQ